jgi:tetratricopeptide (TPR) repeat protein
MATFYSDGRRVTKCKLAAAIIFLFAAAIIFADDAPNKKFAARDEAAFQRTQIQFQSDPNNSTNAWRFASACYDFADFATNDTQRADIALQGIAACHHLIARDAKSAPAHYYLGMNLGQLARTELLGALALVREMEGEFKTAESLDEHFDYAGTSHNLGLLYRDAPGWPASIGNKRKARDWLERAVKLAPDYPENHLTLAESYLQWDDAGRAKLELNALDSVWSKAQTNFTGEAWEQSWDSWSTRRDDARRKLAEISGPQKSAKSPRN